MDYSEFIKEARDLDAQYETHTDLFSFPTFRSLALPKPDGDKTLDSKVNYLCGNSLGLMPVSTPKAIAAELQAWGDRGVESHFRHPKENEGLTSWVDIDLPIVPLLAPIVGAKESEVACMGTLTMNLNALFCAFYRPTQVRYKIMFEKGAFPSDYYAFLNQAKLHGYGEEALVQLAPRDGEHVIRTEDILSAIAEHGSSVAVVCFPGIQYYTGQLFDIPTITRAGHDAGCVVGWDLAHAAGNVELKLHEWDVDFAAWCTYKYLNAGPGGIGGIFVHEKYFGSPNWRPRLAGWWGNNSERRFQMLELFEPIDSALGFRQSNPSVLDVVSLRSALETYTKCGGVQKLRAKSIELTKFLEKLLTSSKHYKTLAESDTTVEPHFVILTPNDASQRGAQLSVLFKPHYDDVEKNVMERVLKYLKSKGTICDERRPDVVRLAPVPAYNTFGDCIECVRLLNEGFEQIN